MNTIKTEMGEPDARKVGSITKIKEVYVTEDCTCILGLKIAYSLNKDGHKTYGEEIYVSSNLLPFLSEMGKENKNE